MTTEHLRRALQILDELQEELQNLDAYTYQSRFREHLLNLRIETRKQLKQRELKPLHEYAQAVEVVWEETNGQP